MPASLNSSTQYFCAFPIKSATALMSILFSLVIFVN